jgi:hypothetical protein
MVGLSCDIKGENDWIALVSILVLITMSLFTKSRSVPAASIRCPRE